MQLINKLFKFKKKYIFFISYLLFINIFSTTFLSANSFKISNVEVSSTFELNFNKNKVIDDGFKASFLNLISMITTSGDKEKIKNISLKEIKGMIDSFRISNERFINNEYFAQLEVTFNKKNVLLFLERKNIFPSIPIRTKVLLIPVFIDLEIDNIHLFTDNIFYEKWNINKKNFHLLDYFLPSEDLEDLDAVQKNFNFIEDYDFNDLIKKYDLEDYIISIIFKNKDELKILSKINLKNTYKVDNQIFKKVDLNNEESFETVLTKLKNIYENYWKKNNEINTSIKLPLTISINSKRYNKIQELNETLNKLDLVADFYILKFDNQNTFFRIIYNGSPKTFFNDMNQRNFNLTIENDIWRIK